MVLKYQHPFPKVPHYDDDDPFGNTSPPWRSPSSPHRGADYNKGIAEVEGTPIPAIADGVVVFSGTAPGLGYMVTLQHPDGVFSGYCHQYAQSPLVEGQPVSRGQSVGGIGGTNGTSDPYAFHLHLTMGTDIAGTKGGSNRFDPIPYIDAHLDGDDTTPPQKEEDDMAAGTLIKRSDQAVVHWQEHPLAPLYPLNGGQFAAYTNQGLKLNDLAPASFDPIIQRVGRYTLDQQERRIPAGTTDAKYEGWQIYLPNRPL